ncbi:polysaccharide pyruvyl transferase family protein [uncultured Bacteroides sp.]|uniref:polysaccharide pyruvyl transferase family protein n=1 Tax=uncultured Bacteroides sp. TaxID=162156 RepID=UPI00259997C8|nr:polysaccharide pyruvyl transferase family protein [uncultured Bacteroides sp.]
MNYSEKIIELRNIINERLLPLIDDDYIYLDLPYYSNIGDILIWEGTLRFLAQTKYKCLYSTDINNFKEKEINENIIIVLQGGGNWGDLWTNHHIFRKKIVEMYPKNRVIVFPQSIYYQDETNMLEDIEFYNRYPNVTICTRDKKSFDIISGNFKNNRILLVPDMAFFVDVQFKPQKTNRILFAKRIDKELALNKDIYKDIPYKAEIHDWPTYEVTIKQRIIDFCLRKITSILIKVDIIFCSKIRSLIMDSLWKFIIKPCYIKRGIDFINYYDEIYSTRLHITILSILMGKNIHIIDNNYRKTRNFIETWFYEEKYKFLQR